MRRRSCSSTHCKTFLFILIETRRATVCGACLGTLLISISNRQVHWRMTECIDVVCSLIVFLLKTLCFGLVWRHFLAEENISWVRIFSKYEYIFIERHLSSDKFMTRVIISPAERELVKNKATATFSIALIFSDSNCRKCRSLEWVVIPFSSRWLIELSYNMGTRAIFKKLLRIIILSTSFFVLLMQVYEDHVQF